jgi:hypothetical protein
MLVASCFAISARMVWVLYRAWDAEDPLANGLGIFVDPLERQYFPVDLFKPTVYKRALRSLVNKKVHSI